MCYEIHKTLAKGENFSAKTLLSLQQKGWNVAKNSNFQDAKCWEVKFIIVKVRIIND